MLSGLPAVMFVQYHYTVCNSLLGWIKESPQLPHAKHFKNMLNPIQKMMLFSEVGYQCVCNVISQ